jgi:acyl dehydratase
VSRDLPPGDYFFDDVAVGDRWRTGGILVTESHVMGFAGLTGDFFDVHVDETFAKDLGFPGRIAHGLLGLAIVDGLKNRAPVRLRAVASLGWTWDFLKPLLIGDRIEAALVVDDLRVTKNPGRGIVTLGFTVTNQRGETVQAGQNKMMMLRRPAAEG